MVQNKIFNTICVLMGNKMKQTIHVSRYIKILYSDPICNHLFSSESYFPTFMSLFSAYRKFKFFFT